jgi:hypothetical protein
MILSSARQAPKPSRMMIIRQTLKYNKIAPQITTAYIHTNISLWLLINTHHVGYKSYEREREREREI